MFDCLIEDAAKIFAVERHVHRGTSPAGMAASAGDSAEERNPIQRDKRIFWPPTRQRTGDVNLRLKNAALHAKLL